MSQELKTHYEELDCSHQNNLLLEYPDKSKNTLGVCPKGCLNTKVLSRVTIDVQKAGIQASQEPV